MSNYTTTTTDVVCAKEKSYLFGLTNRYSEYIISVSSEVIREDYQ